jgi:hypothetical protein
MTDKAVVADGSKNPYVRTRGGLVRTMKLGCPEHTMQFRWNGTCGKPPLPPNRVFGTDKGETKEILIEVELLRIQGDKVTLRLSAPDEVRIVSAKTALRSRGCDPVDGTS